MIRDVVAAVSDERLAVIRAGWLLANPRLVGDAAASSKADVMFHI